MHVDYAGIELPLDSVGTGLLQVIQIFAYIEYFSPKIILLDEPDSHIHPTKQKNLAHELAKRAKANETLKIVFSTHSRYILEALEDQANVVHFQGGRVFEDVKESKILIDIGAADADYLFSKKKLRYIVVTEDKVDNIKEKKAFLKKFILANGLSEDEFVLHSYEGCAKVDFAKILKGFVHKQIPTAEVILHVDRDEKIDSDRDIIKLIDDCEKKSISLFVTKYQEIESYFCDPQHVSNIYGISVEDAREVHEAHIKELEGETKRKLRNFIHRHRRDLALNKDGQIDVAIADGIADDWYAQFGLYLTPGKELLGKTKKFIQETLKADPDLLLEPSEALRDERFLKLITPVE
ncbi:hypothetical protein LO50_02310 [Stutzerimonas stutzeri]|uniref:ATPase AAA-type core domain-containing protein n=1 Tax=Stutzerimonas stutzeri TaxID=316 RepID=A0A0D7ECL8_STUST|nr:hypothetical protein LO50_02310 [Stutzerimonas stutzeri]